MTTATDSSAKTAGRVLLPDHIIPIRYVYSFTLLRIIVHCIDTDWYRKQNFTTPSFYRMKLIGIGRSVEYHSHTIVF
jgi:hypothetical protein